jgi:hypothetical protein
MHDPATDNNKMYYDMNIDDSHDYFHLSVFLSIGFSLTGTTRSDKLNSIIDAAMFIAFMGNYINKNMRLTRRDSYNYGFRCVLSLES